MAGTAYNLLDDYSKLSEAQVEAAHILWIIPASSTTARQNAQMMYECLMASITDEAKSSLASHEVDFSEDGPKLFFHMVNHLFTVTFSNMQATWDYLSDFTQKGTNTILSRSTTTSVPLSRPSRQPQQLVG